jgi:hypothetical protein
LLKGATTVNPKGTDLFVTDAGTEVSVRTSRETSTNALTIEPLYATDIELLDGATGELHAQGETLRGRVRRKGAAFVLVPEQPRTRVKSKKREVAPPAVPVMPVAATASADPVRQASASATSNAGALEAADTVSRFVRGERDVPLKEVRRAHSVIGRFIAEREREARARQ